MTKSTLNRFVRKILPARLSHALANLVRSHRRRKFKSRIVEHSYCGHLFKVCIDDAMAEAWYDHDWDDGFEELKELSNRRLTKGCGIFDIGSHQGVVALMMAQIVGQDGQVVAVEGDPWNASRAAKNFDLNSAKNIRPVNAIVGANGDCAADKLAPENLMSQWSRDQVPMRSVDSLASEYGNPNVIYVDVDGFELQVLSGASAVLSQKIDWFVEVHVGCGLEDQGGSWQEVLSFFPEEIYERLIASESQKRFTNFDITSPLLEDRFFLLAFHRGSCQRQ